MAWKFAKSWWEEIQIFILVFISAYDSGLCIFVYPATNITIVAGRQIVHFEWKIYWYPDEFGGAYLFHFRLLDSMVSMEDV